MKSWESWFAWRPVKIAHTYANCPCTAWFTRVSRLKTPKWYIYALPGWESKVGEREEGFFTMHRWLAEHMPELHARLGPLTIDDARAELVRVTGVQVLTSDHVDDGSRRFLDALKKMQQ